MLTEALGLSHSFCQAEIENLRWHIAIQLLRCVIFLPDYHIQATSSSRLPARTFTPQSIHSQSDIEAAITLLDLSAAEPHVRFSTEVNIREYKGSVD